MPESSKPSKTPENSLLPYHMESMPLQEVCVYSMRDGEMTCSERQWPISPNELLLIIPKQQVSELKHNIQSRSSFFKHMMLFFSVLDENMLKVSSPSQGERWKDPSISPRVPLNEDI